MSSSIKNKKANYREVEGKKFYSYIFPNNQDQGELSEDYSKPNTVYLYKDPKDEV